MLPHARRILCVDDHRIVRDGIALITWDMPGRSMNVLNEASMTAYAGAIEEAIKDDKVKGVILTSAKADFIAGKLLQIDADNVHALAHRVYAARDTELGREVALKVASLDNQDAQARLRREAQHAVRADAPG